MKIEPIKEVTGFTISLDKGSAFNLRQAIGYVWEAMSLDDDEMFKKDHPQFHSALDAFQGLLADATDEVMFKSRPQMKEGQ